MKMERPDRFGGEGYCLMTKGAMENESDASVRNLSKEEQVFLCAKEVIAAFPSRRFEDVHQQDTEEATREKVMAQVKFETSIFKIQQKFGEELMKEVLDAAKPGAVGVKGLAGTPELEELKAKIQMMDANPEPMQAAPPSQAGQAREQGPSQAAGPAQVPSSPPAAPPTTTPAPFPTALVVSIAVAAAGIFLGGFLILKRRRE
mmetsp:Transcript_22148/g.27294  ORF Transcript_22148/g.27294 Transcript_22148/m.27294 type:complete len:203 (+) Transcript_22148:1-609(+)